MRFYTITRGPPRFSETDRWHSENADRQCKIRARWSVGRVLRGPVMSNLTQLFLEADGCAWMIAHMYQFDLSQALRVVAN